jgi:hypothetical protein
VFIFLKLSLNSGKQNYNSAFVEKLIILKKYRHQKKIVLIGGSSVGWGLSAELIESETGIKTINLGHHAGFGLIDFQSFIIKNLNKDDIIIFSPEWIFYTDPTFYDKATLDNLIRYNIGYGELLQNDFYKLSTLFTKINIESFQDDNLGNPYRYDCLNTNGDIISHCGLKAKLPQYYTIDNEHIAVERFKELFPFIVNNKTIFLYPPTQKKVYERNKIFLNKINNTMLKNRYCVVDKIEDNVYKDDCFFDSQYHLTCEERIKRTGKLIIFLKKMYNLN